MMFMKASVRRLTAQWKRSMNTLGVFWSTSVRLAGWMGWALLWLRRRRCIRSYAGHMPYTAVSVHGSSCKDVIVHPGFVHLLPRQHVLHLLDLPSAVLNEAAKWLSAKDLCALALVSKRCRCAHPLANWSLFRSLRGCHYLYTGTCSPGAGPLPQRKHCGSSCAVASSVHHISCKQTQLSVGVLFTGTASCPLALGSARHHCSVAYMFADPASPTTKATCAVLASTTTGDSSMGFALMYWPTI
jgi:hypothetical protein